jgi:Ner family transcriptional regulator
VSSDAKRFRDGFSKENFISTMNNSDSTPPEAPTDWHPADVLAALKKRGQSLAGLSVAHGYHPTAAGKALKRPWPALEAIIAEALGLAAAQIWPTRYSASGQPISARDPR